MVYKLEISIPTECAKLIGQSLLPDKELSKNVERIIKYNETTLSASFTGERAKDVRVSARSTIDDIKLLIRTSIEVNDM